MEYTTLCSDYTFARHSGLIKMHLYYGAIAMSKVQIHALHLIQRRKQRVGLASSAAAARRGSLSPAMGFLLINISSERITAGIECRACVCVSFAVQMLIQFSTRSSRL